jgi:hypothetical protein
MTDFMWIFLSRHDHQTRLDSDCAERRLGAGALPHPAAQLSLGLRRTFTLGAAENKMGGCVFYSPEIDAG